jgi:hypothetical protein
VPGTGPGYTDGQYPNDVVGETPHSGMANTLTALWKDRGGAGEYVTAHSVVGWSGKCITDIDKSGGQRAYPATLVEGRAWAAIATANGRKFGYGAIVLTHGECDASNASYGAQVFQLWKDYNADLKAITGQRDDIVLLVSQQSTKATGSEGSAAQMWRAGNDHPGQIVCTGPKYAYQYSPDRLHLPAAGYRRLGEKYAEVFDVVVNQRRAWKPLGPTLALRNGAVIRVDFHVPNPPLVWSDHLEAPHQTVNAEWAAGKGFEVIDGEGKNVAIESVRIAGSSVLVTLKNAPAAGTAITVRYAIAQDGADNQGGSVLGLRGLLRDSDPFVGADVEEISTRVTQGSRVVTSAVAGAFRRRTGYDVVSREGAPTGLVVTSRDSDDQLTLSAPWTGDTGTVPLSFRYDQYNYCVHFALPVP